MDKVEIRAVETRFYKDIARFLVERWLRDLLIFALFIAGAATAFWLLRQQSEKDRRDYERGSEDN